MVPRPSWLTVTVEIALSGSTFQARRSTASLILVLIVAWSAGCSPCRSRVKALVAEPNSLRLETLDGSSSANVILSAMIHSFLVLFVYRTGFLRCTLVYDR